MPKGPNGQKRPADAIGLAVMIGKIATGEIEDERDNAKSGHMYLLQTQSDKFKEAARELECDPDEARWEDKLRKVVKPKQPTDDDLRDKLAMLHEQAKQVLRNAGMSEADIEAQISSKGKRQK